MLLISSLSEKEDTVTCLWKNQTIFMAVIIRISVLSPPLVITSIWMVISTEIDEDRMSPFGFNWVQCKRGRTHCHAPEEAK